MAEEHGTKLSIIEAAVRANERQREHMVQKIRDAMGPLKGKTIAVLGLSFKPNTDDIRDAPSLPIVRSLLQEKPTIRAYDPVSMKEAAKILSHLQYCEDPYDALKGADALVIMTEWNLFRNLELDRVRKLMKGNYFFDLRNVYDSEKVRGKGFQYFGVGRS
jgi:UDPglucose 6-dehydrogenase